MKLLSLVLLLTICSCGSRNNKKIKEDALHQDSIHKLDSIRIQDSIIKKAHELDINIENDARLYHYSLNSPENVIYIRHDMLNDILNEGNDTLITDKGLFLIKSEMSENKAYNYHLYYKGKRIGLYTEEFNDISEYIFLDPAFVIKEQNFDLVGISTDSLKKITLPLFKKKFLKKYKIIE